MEARASAAFVGRVRELDELERALLAAQAGDGTTVLVAGEAGIGKSRLAAEVAHRARAAGFEVLLGRSLDLVGTELPYQPFADALPSFAELREADSQLRVFEAALALLGDRGAVAPALLVLEDLHWADASTLDLVVFLAHNLDGRRVVLLATCRPDEPASAARVRRLADGVRRSGSAVLLELGPLARPELAALLAAQDAALPAAVRDAILARSEGNPFFAEELLAASGAEGGELPRRLRDVLTARVAGLDRPAQSLLRVAAAAGRDVSYALLVAVGAQPEREVRESLRAVVERGVLVADRASGRFRFRHALLAEAIAATILPGEFEWLHARVADELARSGTAGPAELATHWALAGRSSDALAASVAAAGEAEAVFGVAEALGHLERALSLWDSVPDAAAVTGADLGRLCDRAAVLASQVGAASRAVELGRRAIALAGADDPRRRALLHVRLGEYLYETGSEDAALAELTGAVGIVPADPPSPERAYALGSAAGALMLARRYGESLALAEQALALARAVGAGEAEVRALTVVGMDRAHLGRGEDGVALMRDALRLAEAIGDHWGLDRAYVNLTDVLTMLGRPGESAQVGQEALEAMRRYGIHSTLILTNRLEALLASGAWDEADRLSAATLRSLTSSFEYMPLVMRADLEVGRGRFDAAHTHLAAARPMVRDEVGLTAYREVVVELALWQRRWSEAAAEVRDVLQRAPLRAGPETEVRLCARGLRAEAELAALARARREADALDGALGRAQALLDIARRAAAEARPVAPNAAAWYAVADAEHDRARGVARPDRWAAAAAAWERLDRPPLAAYCRWREAEALVAAGAPRADATRPLRAAYATAARLDAQPLLRELTLLAERARLDPAPDEPQPLQRPGLAVALGLTPREAEVLALVARGRTNREIADALVISVKTAGVHVSNILRKLDAPDRREAAAIAHRVAPPERGAGPQPGALPAASER